MASFRRLFNSALTALCLGLLAHISAFAQTATPVPTAVPPIDSVADVTGGVADALGSTISINVLGLLAVSAFVLLLARVFGPRLVKALK